MEMTQSTIIPLSFSGNNVVFNKLLRGRSLSMALPSERKAMRQNRFPPEWNEERVQKVLRHYEEQTEDEAVAEDEAAP
jgi:hypothetical protein